MELTANEEQKETGKAPKDKKFDLQPGLITLMLGGLSLGMAEFMIMGVLPDVAQSLQVSIPVAGQLISLYALGVVIGAPLMVMLAGKFPPKQLLMAMMGMFGLFNGIFALAPNHETLAAARLFSGLPHGAFFGVGAVVASKLAAPGREARAVSVMFAGLTVANLIGVPLGTWIGHQFSWRISFGIVALVAWITAISIRKWLPNVATQQNGSARESLQVFKSPAFWTIIGISAIGTGGMFTWISYIAPLMINVSGFPAGSMMLIMMVAGLGMAVGNFIGGRLADRYSPLKTTASLLLAMIVCLLAVALLSKYQVISILLTFVTGATAFAVIAPMQMLMISHAKNAEMLASATLQASANTGNALGAFLGGLPIAAGFGYTSPEYVGVVLAFIGFLFCMLLRTIPRQLSVQKHPAV
ncbi:putative major facilitator superfamily transporter [Flavihumibacter petaseus NBRC 106054]|uniref:Putative major facilitator superfamily transporter n=2 Tax=Flavihumibacter TaxID=1004301 RepID=A0A0E9MVZ2_9BACT|nr:putative major facilitator superfamily transporter [Flavihumibacter petaseus NBRC 106054]